MENYEENYERYIRDIEGYPRITYEREKDLAKIIQNPETTQAEKESAKQEFILSNLRLVVTAANRVYSSCRNMPDANLSIMDLIQAGNQALTRAIELYDGNDKTRFNSYAFASIERRMWRAVKATRFIRIPSKYFRYMHVLDEIRERQEDLSDKALAHEMKIKESTLQKVRLTRYAKAEFKDAAEEDGVMAAEDGTAILSKRIADIDLKKYVFEKNKELTPRQRTVLFYRFFSNTNITLEEISKRLGITRQGVAQDLNTALKKIREKVLHEDKIGHVPFKKKLKRKKSQFNA
jgi:RNA polymerase sigma-32 factor